jgi:hypothetical protein
MKSSTRAFIHDGPNQEEKRQPGDDRGLKLPPDHQTPFVCQVLGVDPRDPHGAMLLLMVCGSPFSVFKVPVSIEDAMRWNQVPHGTKIQLHAMFMVLPTNVGEKPDESQES